MWIYICTRICVCARVLVCVIYVCILVRECVWARVCVREMSKKAMKLSDPYDHFLKIIRYRGTLVAAILDNAYTFYKICLCLFLACSGLVRGFLSYPPRSDDLSFNRTGDYCPYGCTSDILCTFYVRCTTGDCHIEFGDDQANLTSQPDCTVFYSTCA